MRAELARRWGCCAPNRFADRAGPHRRIALGLAAVCLPLVVVSAGALAGGGLSTSGSAAAHLVSAIGCGWLAADLFRTGRVTRLNGLPHTSSVVLLGGIGMLVVFARVEPSIGFGPPILLVTGLGLLVGGYILLMTAERLRDRSLAVVGRWAIVGGAVLVGAVELGRTISMLPGAPIEAGGLGLVAVSILATGCFEARVLLRGAALLRALAQR